MSSLALKNIYKIYDGDVTAVNNFNLDIEDKEFIIFVGPSGCGKSTFLRTLNRMNDLIETVKITGNVTLDGDDIYSDIDVMKLRTRVGMVFQKPNPFPMSIYLSDL